MNDAVQQIKDKLSIVDVISGYVELQRSGPHLKAKCPFHNEKTASFNVSPERGRYHCFGCGADGDMFTFVQEMDGLDFKEALKVLAQKANVELTPVSPQKKSEKERLYAILEEATKFYETSLAGAKEVHDYIKKRGVEEETIKIWRLGFAPGPPEAGWGVLKEHLQKAGFTEAEMFKAGLIKESAKGKDSYDVFRNRAMFPLFDQSGHVVAFSGRTMETGPDIPKYVNSPETELFKKSEILYGYDKAKQGIRRLNFSLVVEGQFDVVMSHQAKYNNTVAVSGTALTPLHVQLLERLSTKVVLALDSDKAGIAAVRKAADLMLRRGLDVKVAMLPPGKDPADIVQQDVKDYKHAIGKSVHVIEFLLKVLAEEKLDERTFKLRAREEIIPYIILLPNHIDQDHFEGKLAEALKTTKEAIHYEVERLNEKKKGTVENVEEPRREVVKNNSVSIELPKLTGSLLTYLIGVLPVLDAKMVAKVKELLESITGKTFTELDSSVTETAKAEVLFMVESFLSNNPRKVFDEELVSRINKYRDTVVKLQLKELKDLQKEAELTGNEDEGLALSMKIGELSKLRQIEPYTLESLTDKD